MGLRHISCSVVPNNLVSALGLNPESYGLGAEETIAKAIRRVASFLSPCSASALISATIEPMKGIVEDLDLYTNTANDILESLIAAGDLLEVDYSDHDPRGFRGPTIYAAPPCFVRRKSGALVLFGITPDCTSLLNEEMQKRIIYKRHIRLLAPDSALEDAAVLKGLGYIELSFDAWSKLPRVESPAEFIKRADLMLNAAPPSGSIEELEIIGPWPSGLFYKGRWVKPSNQCGRYVGRRKQAYRADIWGYFELLNGEPVRFIDFPLDSKLNRGCDEAWRLQAALDNSGGTPQIYKIRSAPGDDLIIDFFAPVPRWAIRRWDIVGEPISRQKNLFSYVFSTKEINEELDFIEKYLWLKKT